MCRSALLHFSNTHWPAQGLCPEVGGPNQGTGQHCQDLNPASHPCCLTFKCSYPDDLLGFGGNGKNGQHFQCYHQYTTCADPFVSHTKSTHNATLLFQKLLPNSKGFGRIAGENYYFYGLWFVALIEQALNRPFTKTARYCFLEMLVKVRS